jgi:tetratricopeptide (TPR) repeat protein
MHFLDPSFPAPGDLQRFRLQYRRREGKESLEDEEVRGFQAFLRAIQMAILRIATGETPSATPEEGARQIAILQFIQRLFQWNSADIQFERGEDWRRRGNLTEALAAYDRALNMDPNFALAWSRRGDVLVQLARYREAVDSYNGSLSINPYDEETRLRLALILGRLGQYKSAVVNYDKVLESNPEDALAWHNRGIRLLQLKRSKLALNSLNKALRYNPKQPPHLAGAWDRAAAAASAQLGSGQFCPGLEAQPQKRAGLALPRQCPLPLPPAALGCRVLQALAAAASPGSHHPAQLGGGPAALGAVSAGQQGSRTRPALRCRQLQKLVRPRRGLPEIGLPERSLHPLRGSPQDQAGALSSPLCPGNGPAGAGAI